MSTSPTLKSPRNLIYVVMIVGGLVWGIQFIYGVMKDAGVWHVRH